MTHFEAILKHFEEFWSILKHFEAFRSIFKAFWHILKQFWSILKNFEEFWSILKHLEAFWNILKHFDAYWSNFKAFRKISCSETSNFPLLKLITFLFKSDHFPAFWNFVEIWSATSPPGGPAHLAGYRIRSLLGTISLIATRTLRSETSVREKLTIPCMI